MLNTSSCLFGQYLHWQRQAKNFSYTETNIGKHAFLNLEVIENVYLYILWYIYDAFSQFFLLDICILLMSFKSVGKFRNRYRYYLLNLYICMMLLVGSLFTRGILFCQVKYNILAIPSSFPSLQQQIILRWKEVTMNTLK